MIWFYRYRFVLDQQTTDAVKFVQALGARSPNDVIGYRVKANHLRLWVKLQFFRNSWNPVFDGRLEQIGSTSELRGFFRPNWFVLAFTIFLLGYAAFDLIEAIRSPAVQPGYVPDWKDKLVHFQVEFLAGAFLICVVGWVAGLSAQFKMLRLFRAIARST